MYVYVPPPWMSGVVKPSGLEETICATFSAFVNAIVSPTATLTVPGCGPLPVRVTPMVFASAKPAYARPIAAHAPATATATLKRPRPLATSTTPLDPTSPHRTPDSRGRACPFG